MNVLFPLFCSLVHILIDSLSFPAHRLIVIIMLLLYIHNDMPIAHAISNGHGHPLVATSAFTSQSRHTEKCVPTHPVGVPAVLSGVSTPLITTVWETELAHHSVCPLHCQWRVSGLAAAGPRITCGSSSLRVRSYRMVIIPHQPSKAT